MIVVIDNYDSFTYNLVHLIGRRGVQLRVVRNDELTVSEIADLSPQGILISPGPGRPADAGVSKAVIEELGADVPILGVCLGHQAIGEVFGATVTYAPELMHGKTSEVLHQGAGVFAGAPSPMTATRYHSLTLAPETVPDVLEPTAWTADGVIMGVRHRDLPIEGVQFHPESVLTEHGPLLVENWLGRCGAMAEVAA
jgi:anthranilate synthase/aminodeoxychorismate synthase-like glutamine amidotransferase